MTVDRLMRGTDVELLLLYLLSMCAAAVAVTFAACLCSSKDGFPTLRGVKTLYESLEQTVKNHSEKPALGWRPMTDGKAGPYEWMTYGQVQGMLPVLSWRACVFCTSRHASHLARAKVVLHAHVMIGMLRWDCRQGQGDWLCHPGQRGQAQE